MTLQISKTNYKGNIREITLGNESGKIAIGGEDCYPFYLFEGKMPNLPKIAMEVWDYDPVEWPAAAREPFAGVLDNPVAWAQKCVSEYGAEMLALQLVSTDPNGIDRSADEAAKTVSAVAVAVSVPLIVWGTANTEKDTEVLSKVCEMCHGRNLIIGPVEEANHKKIGAAALAYNHTLIASSPIDVNLAKQLNILLGNLGVPESKLIMDPTVSSIGYGLEYCYSVMERIRMAALAQDDNKLQLPFICNIARETWKAKESNSMDGDERYGDDATRGILMEAMSATALLLAGGDVMIMRHPVAIRLVKEIITDLTT